MFLGDRSGKVKKKSSMQFSVIFYLTGSVAMALTNVTTFVSIIVHSSSKSQRPKNGMSRFLSRCSDFYFAASW